MFSIALANMITPLIDGSIRGNTFDNLFKRYLRIACVLIICVGIATGYAALPKSEETASAYKNDITLLNHGGDIDE